MKTKYYTCLLYEGRNARGKLLKTWRMKTISEDYARNAFTNKFQIFNEYLRYLYPAKYLVVECGDLRVGKPFGLPAPNDYDDEDESEYEVEDDLEDDEEEYFEEEEEDYEEEWDYD